MQGQVAFDREKYNSEQEMWTEVQKLLAVLCNADYKAVVRWDDRGVGILVVEFGYNGPDLNSTLVWLSEDEYVTSWRNEGSECSEDYED